MGVLATKLCCDGCGKVPDFPDGKLRRPWSRHRFKPGVLNRTEPRPDIFACSDGCRSKLRAREDAEMAALPSSLPEVK